MNLGLQQMIVYINNYVLNLLLICYFLQIVTHIFKQYIFPISILSLALSTGRDTAIQTYTYL